MSDYTPNEMMTVAAARALSSSDVCFVGIGAPSAACNLARLAGSIGERRRCQRGRRCGGG